MTEQDASPQQPAPRKKPREGTRRRRGNARASDAIPFKLFNFVPITFGDAFERFEYDAQELLLRPKDRVVVETARGPTIGQVAEHPQRKRSTSAEAPPRVLRKATEADEAQLIKNATLEREAQRFALERIRARRLPMKLIRAQLMLDASKLIFYFAAEGRIDFRELVKDLAHRFRNRIEMHQIGVRDGAKALGGIGPCGRELCCSTFLESFAPVSIRMAKDQGLTLNPKKVSGMCGRLMCCLVYEQQIYKKLRKQLPKPGLTVTTPQGPGQIISVDVLQRRITARLEDMTTQTFDAADLILSPNTPQHVDDDDADDAPLFDDVLSDDDSSPQEAPPPKKRPEPRQRPEPATEQEPPKPKRRRRQRAATSQAEPDAPPAATTEPPPRPEAHDEEPSGDAAKKSRRRRRRRPAKKDE